MFLKYRVRLGTLICAFCPFEAGYGVIVRSEGLFAEPPGPLGTVNGTGPSARLPPADWLQ